MVKLWPALGLILLAFPIMEIWFAVAAVHWFGFAACFMWWLASLGMGLLILRTQRLALKTQMLMLASGQRNPLGAVLWMARRTLAAILLLLPGFLSDALALILLLPWPMPKSLRLQGEAGARAAAFPPGFDAAFEQSTRWRQSAGNDAAADPLDGEFKRVDGDAAPLPHDHREQQ